MRIVVHCPNLIGDTVMATPTLRALREAYPTAVLDVVVKPQVAPTLEGNPWIDSRVLHAPGSREAAQRTLAVARRLRAVGYDLGVLLPNSWRSALLFAIGGVRRRIGYARSGRGCLLSDRLHAPRGADGRFTPTPAVEYYLALARLAGCARVSTRLELFTTSVDEQAADRAWSDLGIAPGRPVVLLNTGGAFGPAKSWPNPAFATLARRLVADRGASVVVLCGPNERAAAREIVRLADCPGVTSLADQPMSIGLSKACVRRADLLITTDSGPRHFAAAFGVPVVSLFGPTHIAWTRTYHPQAIHLQQPVPCGPCQQGICPLGHHRCMTELHPDAVYAAAARLLGPVAAGSAPR